VPALDVSLQQPVAKELFSKWGVLIERLRGMGPEGAKQASTMMDYCFAGTADHAAALYVETARRMASLAKGRFIFIPEAARPTAKALPYVKAAFLRVGIEIPDAALMPYASVSDSAATGVFSALKLPVGKVVRYGAPAIGTGLIVAVDGLAEYSETKNVARSVAVGAAGGGGALGGALAGAELGAVACGSLGTVTVPGLGTVTGAVACGVVGGVVGGIVGEKAVAATARSVWSRLERK